MNKYASLNKIAVIFIIFISMSVNWSGIIIAETKDKKSIAAIDHVDNNSNFNVISSRTNNGPANSPWPMFHHGLNHTGRSQYNPSKNNGRMKWMFVTGNDTGSSPAIGSDGTIYIGSSDHNLYAVNPNGTKKWSFTTGNEVQSSPAIGSDGTIYVGSLDHNLYAINKDSSKKWSFTTGSEVWSSPAISPDGIIYIGALDNKLYAINQDGTKKWFFNTGNLSSSPAIGPDGTIYVGSMDHNLYAINPNGTKKWSFATESWVQNSSPAIGPDGTIYIGSFDKRLYAINSNGTKKWSFATRDVIVSSPAIGSDGTIYFGSRDYNLYAINPNGTEKWSFATKSWVDSSPAIGSDGTIYFGSWDYNLYAINPNGTKKWNFTTGSWGRVRSSPAIGSDGTIYFVSFGSLDSNLYAIGTTPPAAPRNLTAIGGNTQVELTWQASINDSGPSVTNTSLYRNPAITNYTIYRGTTSGCETFLVKLGNVNSYLDKDLKNGQKYFYKVTANNSVGESPRSNEANATPATIPTAPRGLTAVPGNAQITLNWTTPADNGGASITNYTLYRNGTLLKVLGNSLSYVDTGLINGVTYSYNVTPLNREGEGPRSIGISSVPRTVPTAPQNLTAVFAKNRITLNWTAPAYNGGASITNYTIYRRTVTSTEVPLVKGYMVGTSWVDTNITFGTTYYYKVSAVNIAGEGPRSNEGSIIIGNPPVIPIGLTASEGNAQVILKWSSSITGGTPTRYNVYRSDSQTGTYVMIGFILGSPPTTQLRDIGLTNGHTYWYKINAQNQYGISGNTTAIQAKPFKTTTISIGPILLLIIIIIIIIVIIGEIKRLSDKKKDRYNR